MPDHISTLAERYMDILLIDKPPIIINILPDLMYQFYTKGSVDTLITKPTMSNVVKFLKKSLRSDCWKVLFLKGYFKTKIKLIACLLFPLSLVRKMYAVLNHSKRTLM
jgi:hypothetical protein